MAILYLNVNIYIKYMNYIKKYVNKYIKSHFHKKTVIHVTLRGYTDGRTDTRTDGRIHERTDGQTDRGTGGRMDRGTDGRTDDGRTDGRTDGYCLMLSYQLATKNENWYKRKKERRKG